MRTTSSSRQRPVWISTHVPYVSNSRTLFIAHFRHTSSEAAARSSRLSSAEGRAGLSLTLIGSDADVGKVCSSIIANSSPLWASASGGRGLGAGACRVLTAESFSRRRENTNTHTHKHRDTNTHTHTHTPTHPPTHTHLHPTRQRCSQ